VTADASVTPDPASDGNGPAYAAAAEGVPAPRRWEQMLVDAAVRRGGPGRWRRRLEGLDAELQAREIEAGRDDPDAPQAQAIRRDRERLHSLADFALPLIDGLAAWPNEGTWGEWLDRFASLAPRILRYPERVIRVVGELRPMSDIGPVSLEEARDVIAERLLLLESEPPKSRYGRVFVGGPQQARGRTFKVVFVPGLAERMFPQKPHEDPMMLDEELREHIDRRTAELDSEYA